MSDLMRRTLRLWKADIRLLMGRLMLDAAKMFRRAAEWLITGAEI